MENCMHDKLENFYSLNLTTSNILSFLLHKSLKNLYAINFCWRYSIGNKDLPYFPPWVKEMLAVKLEERCQPQSLPESYPEPRVSEEFCQFLRKLRIEYSIEGIDRLIRSHGHALREIYLLKHGKVERIPDIVVWPSTIFLFKEI